MAEFRYGMPPTPYVEHPRCWGRSFDDLSGECRRCGYQNSCKDEIIRLNVGRQMSSPIVPQPAYGGPYPTAPYAAPQPAQPVMFQHQMMRSQATAPPVFHESAQRAIVPMQMVQQPPYGWLHDPLYYTMAATPPPVRNQLQGESFVGRVAKNTALAMIESLFGQCFLAIRQLILPPALPKTDVPELPPHPPYPPGQA